MLPGTDELRSRRERIAALGFDYDGQPKERPECCNLCGSAGCPVEVARHDRYGYPATLVVCGRCGLGYLAPRLTAAAYARFYAGVYRPLVSAFHGRRIDAETLPADQRAYGAALAGFLAPVLGSSPRTILDVGGSTGVVGGVVGAALGARPTVLDPAPEELAVARAAGMDTVVGFAEDFEAQGRRWDLVLLCQTVDHLLDVRSTLTAMRDMTSTEGRAFVDILDVGFMLRRTGSIEAAVKIDHPYYLTRPTAAALFALTGYDIVAERLADDGHRGFVLAPAPCTEPDWSALQQATVDFVDAVWARRAAAPPPEPS